MKNTFCFLILMISTTIAKGEFVVKESALTEEGEEIVIDLSFLAGIEFEDPHFSPPKLEREIASPSGEEEKSSFGVGKNSNVEWQGGQIHILKDIPYSYPQLSRSSIEAQVLEELKKEQNQ